MRLVFWNIRAGGGVRVPAILERLRNWTPDVVALCEFRGTPPSLALALGVGAQGLVHQRTTTDPLDPRANRLMVASRWPLSPIRLDPASPLSGLCLFAMVGAPAPFTLGAVHVPNRVTGRKDVFLDAVLARLRGWRRGPALLLGDTNSGLPGLDEEVPVFGPGEASWLTALHRMGWADAFRHLHGDTRVYTWYSPNGRNGFRLDQAFLNRDLTPRLQAVQYDWGGRARRPLGPSDHAALLLDLAD